MGVYLIPIYPFDNTNEYLKLFGVYVNQNGQEVPFEIIIYYNYTGFLLGKMLRIDLLNVPYFKDNLSVIIEYEFEDTTN